MHLYSFEELILNDTTQENITTTLLNVEQILFCPTLYYGWLVGISTTVGYLCQIHFYTNNQFYFKQFSYA